MSLHRLFTIATKGALLSASLLCLLGTVAFAQVRVTGTVTNGEDNSPLAGVAVLIKGTTVGVYTGDDGKYAIDAPDANSILVYSYYGYANKEEAISGRTSIDVTLTSSVGTLDEVIVTGYTTQREREKTSAIVSVKAEDFNQGNISNPAQLIQGKVAGVAISRPGGNPNGNFIIRLRGLATVGANSSPLIIIDGVLNADLNTVDPNDIASVDILKDGSAAAIYGTQAASGVIIITTKRGLPGTSTVDYNGFVTAEFVDKVTEVLDAGEYRDLVRETGVGTDLGSSTDWIEELTRTGISQVHNISMGGGTNKTSYRASVNFRDVEGIAVSSGFNQLNARLNIDQKAINDRLSISLNLTTTTRDQDEISNAAFRYAQIYNPTAPIFGTGPDFDKYDGYFQQTLFDYFNPVAIAEQVELQNKFNRILGSLRGQFEIIAGLKVSAIYSQQRTSALFGQYADKNSFFGNGLDRRGLASRSTGQFFNELYENTITYQSTVNEKFTYNLLGGYTYQNFVNEGFSATGGNFLTDEFSFNSLGSAADFDKGLGDVSSFKNSNKLIAFFGRAEFGIDETYFLSAVYRREGSTRFGEDNKWGDFPGFSGAVVLSNLIKLPNVDFLKFRLGYGVTGAQPGLSYLSFLSFSSGSSFFYNGEFIQSYGPVRNPNPNLQWESKSDINIGLDFNLLNYRLNGSIEYYQTDTKDVILQQEVPVPPNLSSTTFANIGQIRNRGLEISVGYKIIDKPNLKWETSLPTTFFLENTLVKYLGEGTTDISDMGSPGQNGTPLVRIEEGQPIGQLLGLKYVRINEQGNWVFEDTDGDGNVGEADDRQIIGNGLPKFQIGWNNTINVGKFDINFFFRGVFGHDLINSFDALYGSTAPAILGSYNIPKSTLDIKNLKDAPKFSSYHVEKADFVKLDNATVGYTFDVKKLGWINKCRLYLNGQGLFTITNYGGVDPEVRFVDEENGNPLAPGIERRDTYARSKGVTFGVNLGF